MRNIIFIVVLMMLSSCSSDFYFPSECELTNRQIEREIRILEEQTRTPGIEAQIADLRDELIVCPKYEN